MKNLLFTALTACALGGLSGGADAQNLTNHQNLPGAETPVEIYEWRLYTLAEGVDPALLDDFFANALIPAYGKHGIEVGAFAPADTYPEFPAGARYLFMAWPDIETYRRVSRLVREDTDFLKAGAAYFDASAIEPAYTNFETYLCEAFAGPLRRPSPERGLLELRIYRSPNVEANERKIKMFENGEIAVFDEVGVNVVCFGRTLAGSRMPSLAYLTWYKDAETRAEAWAKFGTHPEWRRMRDLPEYANTATDNTSRLLTPMPWSKY
jgi:hypothetical protein